MLPRIVLFAVVSFLTLSSMAQTKPSRKPAKQPTTANQIHASSLVIDSHADTTQRLLDENFDMANQPAGDLRRPFDRERHSTAPRILSARRPLYDAHVVEH